MPLLLILLAASRPANKRTSERANVRTSEQANKGACDLYKDLAHLRSEAFDYPRQAGRGAKMQADEMLLLFSTVRTSSVRRVLEIGGYHGDSAFNFLQALRCKRGAAVVTVDLRPVKQWKEHSVPHRTLLKDAANLTMADVDGMPVDAILLDCHAYYATQHIVRRPAAFLPRSWP